MPGKLSMLATPIGNLGDLTLRGLEALRNCEAIACEDTRVTAKILAHFQIQKPLVSIHAHSDAERIGRLLDRCEAGEWIIYASDAGTPGVNDPGGKLVAQAMQRGILVETLPGPSALTAAIAICGFPMERFAYLGFVPQKHGRATFFRELSAREEASVFFESTHRIEKAMTSLIEVLDPARMIFIGRELTKMHETGYRGTVSAVWDQLQQSSLKGEFVIIVAPVTYVD